MNKLILVVLAGYASAAIVAAQSPDSTDAVIKRAVETWEKEREKVKAIECELTITTTEHARKSVITGRVLYPTDITTVMKANAAFDFLSGHFSVRLGGEKYDLRTQKVIQYHDETVFKDKKLYGLLVPPSGKATGVGNGSGSSSDLAIIEGNLHSFPIGDQVWPVLIPFGVVPLTPSQKLHPDNWHTLRAKKHFDLLLQTRTPNVLQSREMLDSPVDTFWKLDEASKVQQRRVEIGGKPSSSITFQYDPHGNAGTQVSGWREEIYDATKLITVRSVKVNRIKVNGSGISAISPPTVTPGMVVAKVTDDTNTSSVVLNPTKQIERFRVSDSGSLVLMPEAPDEPRRKVGAWRVIIASMCLMILCIALFRCGRILFIRNRRLNKESF